MAKDKIKKDMIIKEAVSEFPETREVFLKHGMHCLDCPVASAESIEDGAKVHGLDVDKLMKDLNKTVEKKE